MAVLQVVTGPVAESGQVLAEGTTLRIYYFEAYSDNDNLYPQTYRAEYDVTNGTWKPKGSVDGTAFHVPGAASGDPAPPRVKIVENQVYESGESNSLYFELDGVYEDAETAGVWTYGTLPDGYETSFRSSGSNLVVDALDDRSNVVTATEITTHIAATDNPHAVTYQQVGASAATFTHTQNAASNQWVINHNLDTYPSVTVVDSGGNVVYGDVRYVSSNTVQLEFTAAFSGKAYLN